MPKYPVDKYGFTIFPKDSPYLDARQAEDSDDGEEMNAKAIRDLPAYLAEVGAKVSRPGEDAVAASTAQPSSSAAQPLESENFDYSLPIFRVQSRAALEQLYEGIKAGRVGFNMATGLFELKNKASSSGPQSEPGAWTPSSWRFKPIAQHALYDNPNGLRMSKDKLEHLPPIVTPTEIVRLKRSLRDVAEGKAFLLQGGDCAELFDYCEEGAIESKIKLLLQMSLVLIWGSNKPVVRIARMAGQYAKPRSSPTEMVNGIEIPSFRGDILNGYAVTERTLDPARLVA
jgi:3-deoxy-7-phosphoheptulonate synthase